MSLPCTDFFVSGKGWDSEASGWEWAVHKTTTGEDQGSRQREGRLGGKTADAWGGKGTLQGQNLKSLDLGCLYFEN